MRTAVVIDGAFYLRRIGWTLPHLDRSCPAQMAWSVGCVAGVHVGQRVRSETPFSEARNPQFNPAESSILHRIFFYDCPPLTKRLHYPVSKRALDLAKSPTAVFRAAFHDRLKRHRKLALRLGRLNDDVMWRVKPDAVKRWMDQKEFDPADDDFEIDVTQKGVDMRLGIDIANLAYNQRVDQIVLIAGDGDFVPAAKLARREGIDVVLDSMGATAAKDLLENVDGVRATRFETPFADAPDWDRI